MKVRPSQISTMALASLGDRLLEALVEAVADVGRQRVHRRRVQGDDGDVAVAGEGGHRIDLGHRRFLEMAGGPLVQMRLAAVKFKRLL